jgi:ketosteroid isomerase-like protein
VFGGFDTSDWDCDTLQEKGFWDKGDMRIALTVCLLLLAAALPAERRAGSQFDADRSKLIALENAWNLAQLHHDANAVAQLLPETFVYTDYDGTVMDRARFLEDIKDPNYRATLMTNDDVQVFSYPNAAVVVGTYHSRGKYKGQTFDHRGRFTDTWLYLGGQWKCVATHTNLISKE